MLEDEKATTGSAKPLPSCKDQEHREIIMWVCVGFNKLFAYHVEDLQGRDGARAAGGRVVGGNRVDGGAVQRGHDAARVGVVDDLFHVECGVGAEDQVERAGVDLSGVVQDTRAVDGPLCQCRRVGRRCDTIVAHQNSLDRVAHDVSDGDHLQCVAR